MSVRQTSPRWEWIIRLRKQHTFQSAILYSHILHNALQAWVTQATQCTITTELHSVQHTMQTFTKITSIYTRLLGKTSFEKGNGTAKLRCKTRRNYEKPALGFLFNFNTGTGIWSKEPPFRFRYMSQFLIR